MRFAPRVPAWHLSRPVLVDRVHAGIADGLVIVRGGSGAGKSAVLAEWAARTDRPGVWVVVDDAISSRFALWAHILGALGDGPEDVRVSALEGANEAHLRLVLAEALGRERITLVLDDYHLVTDPRVHDDIEWLVTHAGGRAILATRVVAPFEEPPRAARLGPTVVLPDELAFRPEETAAFLGRRQRTTPDDAATAHSRLAGWPLALRILDLERARRGEAAPLEDVLQAVEEALTGPRPALPPLMRDPEVLAFAARITIAEWLTVDLAAELTGRDDAGDLLAAFEHEGLGSWHDRPSGRVFVMAPFVRAAVSSAATGLDAPTLRSLRRSYASWADRAGESVIAGRQAVELGDWALLAALAQRHFRTLMRLHRREWRDLVAAVPLDRLRRHPVLGAVALQLLNAESAPTDRLRALATVLVSSLAPVRDRGTRVDRIWRNASALAAERISGRYAAASATAERLVTLIAALDLHELDEVGEFLPLLYVQIGTTRLYGGDPIGAVEPLSEAIRSSADAPWSELHARSLLALTSALRGELRDAQRQTAHLDEFCTISGWRGTYSASGYHLARAMLRIEEGDAPRARTELRLLDRHFDTIEHWPLILRIDALAALTEGSAAAAAAALPDRIRHRSRRAGTSAAMRAMLTATHTELLLAAGELRSAERVLRRSDYADSPVVLLSAARVALAADDDGRALTLSSRLLGPAGSSPRLASGSLLVRAVAHHRSGRQTEAAVALTQAVGILHAEGLHTPLALLPRRPLLELRDLLTATDRAVLDTLLGETPDRIPETPPAVRLTEREVAVLVELTRSSSVQTISEALYVSPNTVKTQLRSLYRKLGATSRDEALVAASAEGLLQSD